MSGIEEERRPYKPSFNIQAYNVIDRVDLIIREAQPQPRNY